MSLTDRETLELNDICNALIDGTMTGAQRTRLERWLIDSDDAREYYVRGMDQSASLCHHADERQLEAADRPARPSHWPRPAGWQVMGVAAAVVASAVITWSLGRIHPTTTAASPAELATEFVARITGTKDATWSAEN